MENGKRPRRRQLSPEEKWEVTSRELSQADAARKWGVDGSVIIRLRALAKAAAPAAFASAKRGRPATAEAVELELLRAENDRLSKALKELAVELTLHRQTRQAEAAILTSSMRAAAAGVAAFRSGLLAAASHRAVEGERRGGVSRAR